MNHARIFGVIALLSFLAGCKDKPRVVGPSDAGPLCEQFERLVAGECRVVCSRDGDCAKGEQCNLFVGRCEPKPPVPDAGPIVIPCTTGADRCTADSKGVEHCGADNTWTVSMTCPAGGFCKNEKCLACQPGSAVCAPSDAGASTQVDVCLDDGSGLRAILCAGSSTCTQGECRECTPGSTRCSPDSKALQTCQKQSDETLTWKWNDTGDNFDGKCITQVCELSATGMPQCRAPQCLPGQTTCKTGSTTIQQVCGATGSFNDVSCTIQGDGGVDPAGECQNGVCVHECEEARAAKSYFGCDYWTSVQDNGITAVAFKAGTTSGQGTLPSEFAFVVSNQSLNDSQVTVTRWMGAAPVTVASITVKGRLDPATKGLATIKVPWQSIGADTDFSGVTGLQRYAYRITSTRPMTVYQFNPLAGVAVSGNCSNVNQCTAQPSGYGQTCTAGKCNYYSYSNDASLLLPAHILGTSYVGMAPEHVIARTGSTSGTPSISFNGTLTVVGTEAATTVTVKTTAKTRAGAGITSMAKGEVRTFTLQPYDVLQLSSDNPAGIVNGSTAGNIECGDNPFTAGGPLCLRPIFNTCDQFCRVVDGDITGTIITADKPIATFGSSYCTTRGYLDTACDHVEEQLFPFVTWGKRFVAIRSAPLRLMNGAFATPANAGPDYYKIVAGCPDSACPTGTLVTLSSQPVPADVLSAPGNGCEPGTSLAANNCRLRGGRAVEFRMKSSFTITGDQPIEVGQFFASQNATPGAVGTTAPDQGDPSFILLPPVEQWRAKYTVLTAPIRDNYIGLVIDDSKVAMVLLDGAQVPVSSFVAVAGTTFKVANVAVAVGTHTIDVNPKAGISPLPGAGVTVYGFDQYVSYGYTGGLDLTTIVSGINPGG
jgi:hypothetical protein